MICLLLIMAVHRGVAQDAGVGTPKSPAQRIGRILGVFDEEGRPLDGVEIMDRVGGGTMRTQASGLVGMGVLANQNDSAVVTIRKIGYADTTVLVMVGIRDTVPMQVFLRRATVLDAIVVMAKETERLPWYLRDFESRLSDTLARSAKAFTPAEFRKRDGTLLASLLMTRGIGMGRHVGCLILLDGIPWNVSGADFARESVDTYEAAIFYSHANMPMELPRTRESSTNCAILLYSRHGI
jgi:hypothetical protein